jgi:plasmid stabilization system protein ParE
MTGFVFHPESEADINEIWEYIAADSSAAANRVTDEI